MVATVFLGCNYKQSETEEHSNDKHGHANHHMNKSSFEDLVKRFEASDRDEWQKPNEVIQFFGDLKNKTIIDIGAGTGYFEFKMNEPSAKIIAADVDERFIKYINDRIQKEKAMNITSRKAEYEKPPVNEKEADIVFMVDVYHHIENRKDYFLMVKKGLKANGEMIIVDFKKGDFEQGPPDEMKIEPQIVIDEMKLVGFDLVVQDTTTLKYQYMLKFK
ncbi:MAG: class I SAM-dependent methyltransferase [Bacteroidota bacterium]|nr:class I SAM-dependent methyltransferase [Bacteroidota bacterium]